MVTWAFEFENGGCFEGLRALSTCGIDKPILNFFRMVGLMQRERVWASSSGRIPLPQLVATGARSAPDIDVAGDTVGRQRGGSAVELRR